MFMRFPRTNPIRVKPASLAAATDSGIAIAKEVGSTLIGFVRGKRMNIYNSPEKIFF